MSASNQQRISAFLRAMEAFRGQRRATQSDVAALAELHPNTVSKYTRLLSRRGWIRPAGTLDTGVRGGSPIVWEWCA